MGEKSKEVKYRLACKAGVLKTLYGRSDVRALMEQTPIAHGLESTLQGWRELPQNLGIRAAVAIQSSVGGQGHVHCLCKGACAGKMCSCFRAGRKCNSRCHKGNVKCKNHDDTEQM